MVGSGIRKKPIPDPGSGGQKGTGSRIRIRNRNTAFKSIYGTSQDIVAAVQSAVMDAESQVSRCLNPLVPSGSF